MNGNFTTNSINARQKFTVLLIIGSIGSLALTYLISFLLIHSDCQPTERAQQ